MSPAMGKRTPQKPLAEGRPKRQAVLNRKETLELTKGNIKKEDLKDDPLKEKDSIGSGSSKGKNKNTKTPAQKKKPGPKKKTKPTTKKASPAPTRRSQRNKTKSEDEKTEEEEEEDVEEIEEENPNEIKLDEEEKKNDEDSQNEGTEEENSEEESDPDDGEVTDSNDSDFDPDDDPEKLWCFCKKPHGNRFMICCDTCEGWFHGDCVGISMDKGREMEKTGEEWCCRICKENAAKKTEHEKKSPVKSALNSPLKKTTNLKNIDPATLSKARSLSLDSMKNNLGKKIKDRYLSLSTVTGSTVIKEEDEDKITKHEADRTSVKQEDDKTEAHKLREKRKDSSDSVFANLLTFDHVPTKKEERYIRKSSSDRKESHEESEKKIKSKIRVTPTPKNTEPIKQCHREECTKAAMKGSIYCSRECIYKYANDSIKYLENERKKNLPAESLSSKPTTKGTLTISPAHSTTDNSPTETTQERIAVFEKATGKVVAGVMAPTKKYLFAWLEEHPTYEVLKSNKQADVKNPKKNQDEIVRLNVRKSLREVLTSRCKDSKMPINVEAIGKLCKRIENELLKLFTGETNQKYKTKYRSLIFNLKDLNNKILYKRVISGEITPSKLVNMSPEQLATPELARWRDHESKHDIEMIKKREKEGAEMKKFSGLKKTHKGEVEIDEENESMETLEPKIETPASAAPQPQRELSSPTTTQPPQGTKEMVSIDVMSDLLKDTTEEHNNHLFDSNCKICTGKQAPPGESQVTGVSTTVIQAIPESSVPSPHIEDDISLNSPSSPDTSISLTPTSPNPIPPPSVRKQPSVWRGFVMMQKVAKFVCTAYAVSGTCENLMEILPDTIHVCGRIPPNQVWEYLGQLKEGRKDQRYIDVIRFEMSSDEEKSGYIKLYTYFYTRQRIGVVGNCYSGVKDMYILPLGSHDAIPAELKPLPGLPKPRPHMLVGIIVRVKKLPKKPSEITPANTDSSPEILQPKKKKKKKKEKELELEKEKIEIEAQKKLIDIIFNKKRTTDISQITESTTSGIDPAVSLLKSITSASSSTVTTPITIEGGNNDDFAEDAATTSETKEDIEEIYELKSEEEQMRLLKEQQEEIDRLKASMNITSSELSSTSSFITSPPRNIINADLTLPQERLSPSSQYERTLSSDASENDTSRIKNETDEIELHMTSSSSSSIDSLKASSDMILSRTDALTNVTNVQQESKEELEEMEMKGDESTPRELDDSQDNEYDASATEEIMREALQRTRKTEQDELKMKMKEKDFTPIPLLGTSSITSPVSSPDSNSIGGRVLMSTSGVLGENLASTSSSDGSSSGIPMSTSGNDPVALKMSEGKKKGNIPPSDDDFAMDLIENLDISNILTNQSPLDVIRNRTEKKMPGLPAINLPSTASLPPEIPLPIPGVIPKVPIPPNIKLPPGVPFPPLPPPPMPSSRDANLSPQNTWSKMGPETSRGFGEERSRHLSDSQHHRDPRNMDTRNSDSRKMDPRKPDPRNNVVPRKVDTTIDPRNPDPRGTDPRNRGQPLQERQYGPHSDDMGDYNRESPGYIQQRPKNNNYIQEQCENSNRSDNFRKDCSPVFQSPSNNIRQDYQPINRSDFPINANQEHSTPSHQQEHHRKMQNDFPTDIPEEEDRSLSWRKHDNKSHNEYVHSTDHISPSRNRFNDPHQSSGDRCSGPSHFSDDRFHGPQHSSNNRFLRPPHSSDGRFPGPSNFHTGDHEPHTDSNYGEPHRNRPGPISHVYGHQPRRPSDDHFNDTDSNNTHLRHNHPSNQTKFNEESQQPANFPNRFPFRPDRPEERTRFDHPNSSEFQRPNFQQQQQQQGFQPSGPRFPPPRSMNHRHRNPSEFGPTAPHNNNNPRPYTPNFSDGSLPRPRYPAEQPRNRFQGPRPLMGEDCQPTSTPYMQNVPDSDQSFNNRPTGFNSSRYETPNENDQSNNFPSGFNNPHYPEQQQEQLNFGRGRNQWKSNRDQRGGYRGKRDYRHGRKDKRDKHFGHNNRDRFNDKRRFPQSRYDHDRGDRKRRFSDTMPDNENDSNEYRRNVNHMNIGNQPSTVSKTVKGNELEDGELDDSAK